MVTQDANVDAALGDFDIGILFMTVCIVVGDFQDIAEEEDNTYFMAYFLVAAVLCIIGYITFHNRKKVRQACDPH